MVSDVQIVGLESLGRLSRELRAVGDQGKGFRREVTRSLNAETKEVRKDMRAAISPALPQSGGLAADVLRSTRITNTVSQSTRNPSVRIKARGRRSIKRMNQRGSFRHPVFGNRDVWVTQIAGPPAPGFLDEPFNKSRPGLERAVLSAITRVRADIYRSIT